MYCGNCGRKLLGNELFCPECGEKVIVQEEYKAEETEPMKEVFEQETQQPEENQHCEMNERNNKQQPSMKEYVDLYIRENTAFIDTKAYLEGYKPLKNRWPITLLIAAISALVNPLLPILVLMLSFLVVIFLTEGCLIMFNQEKYSLNNKKVNMDELTLALSEGLADLPLTEWRRGVPTKLGMKIEEQEVIECLFNNKSYHRIVFNTNDSNCYTIKCNDSTKKERFKNGGTKNSVLMYKSDKVLRPILQAAMEYYLKYHL